MLAVALRLTIAFQSDDRNVHRTVRRFTKWLVALSGCRVRLTGAEHLSSYGAAVLVANHSSFADSVVLLAALPLDFRFVVNDEAARYLVIGRAIRKAGHLVVNRQSLRSRAECGRHVVDRLNAGTSLLIYPEGTARAPAAMLPFRNGAFRAAVRTARPVVPIAISGTRDILPRSWRLLRRGDVEITVLPPIFATRDYRKDVEWMRQRAAQSIAGAL